MAARARGKLEEGGISGPAAARLVKVDGSQPKDVVECALGCREVEMGVERLHHVRGLTVWVVCGLAAQPRASLAFESCLPLSRAVCCVPAYGLPGGAGSAEASKALQRHGKVDEDAAKLKRRNALLEVPAGRLARARAECAALAGGLCAEFPPGGYVRIVCSEGGCGGGQQPLGLFLGAPRVSVDEAHTGAPAGCRVTFPVRLAALGGDGSDGSGSGHGESSSSSSSATAQQWALVAAYDEPGSPSVLVNRAFPHLKVAVSGSGSGASALEASAWVGPERANSALWQAVPVGGSGGNGSQPGQQQQQQLVRLESRWLGADSVEKCLQASPGAFDPCHAHFGLVECAVRPMAWASAAFVLERAVVGVGSSSSGGAAFLLAADGSMGGGE
jgi:hypothetical protein